MRVSFGFNVSKNLFNEVHKPEKPPRFFLKKVCGERVPFSNMFGYTLMSRTVADPGFPRGGGANSPGGTPTYDFVKFYQKKHEI